MPIIAALVVFTICRNSSIFGSILFMFRWTKCSPLLAKGDHVLQT